MAASGGRYRLAWFEALLNDRQLLLGCPPPAANITRQQFNVSILVRHKPIPKPVLEPFCLCRLSGRNGGQFNARNPSASKLKPHKPASKIGIRHQFVSCNNAISRNDHRDILLGKRCDAFNSGFEAFQTQFRSAERFRRICPAFTMKITHCRCTNIFSIMDK